MLAATHGEAGALQDLGTDATDVFLRDLVNKLVVVASVGTAGGIAYESRPLKFARIRQSPHG